MMAYNIELTTDEHEPLVIFDEGYLLHYRYYATMVNLRFKFKDTPPTDNDINEAFVHHLRQQLDKTRKHFKSKNLIFAIDGPGNKGWRKEIFPEYKMTRPQNSPISNSVWQSFRDVIREYGLCIEHENLESDDIVALCVKSIKGRDTCTNTLKYKEKAIHIITGDHDFLQLKKFNNVFLYKGNLVEITGSGDPGADMMLKIIGGDPSDNIGGVCGKVKAKKLIAEKKVEEFVNSKPSFLQLYKRNKELVDFDCIPARFVEEFTSKVTIA